MCTVTIIRLDDRFIVTMNRDESKFRGAEVSPESNPNTDWYGPLDSESGGTWFGVSKKGIVGCLLNGYDFEVRKKLPTNPASRGALVPEALQQNTLENIQQWLDRQPLETYRTFRLLVSNDELTTEWRWNGEVLERFNYNVNELVFASSSWKQGEVIKYREELFEKITPLQQDLELNSDQLSKNIAKNYHHLQQSDKTYWGPLITRDEAVTRSITQAIISKENNTKLHYWPSPKPNIMLNPSTTEFYEKNDSSILKD